MLGPVAESELLFSHHWYRVKMSQVSVGLGSSFMSVCTQKGKRLSKNSKFKKFQALLTSLQVWFAVFCRLRTHRTIDISSQSALD